MPISPPKKTAKTKEEKPAAKKAKSKKNGAAPVTGVHAWLELMNKDRRFQGKAQIRTAAEFRTPYTLRRPTGILGLDIVLGGGFHAGGIAEIHGTESVGKTFLAYTVAAQLQRNYGEDTAVLIYSTEIRPDKSFARMAGLCIAYAEDEIKEFDRLRIDTGQKPLTDEEKDDLRKQIGNIVVVVAENDESGLEVVKEAISANVFQLIIIESMGAFLTKDAEEKDISERTYGGSSVPVTTFMNKIYPLLMLDRPDGSLNETTLIGINQARAKIGASRFERDTKAAVGAYAWKHGQLISLLLERGGKIKDEEGGSETGRTIRYTTTKGKAGTHDGKTGSYDHYHLPKMEPVFWHDVEEAWYGGIDVFTELVETGRAMDVIGGNKTWLTYKFNGKEKSFQGKAKMAQAIAENPEMADAIRAECLRKAGILVRYR
jgi:RecA/RadA recombinase